MNPVIWTPETWPGEHEGQTVDVMAATVGEGAGRFEATAGPGYTPGFAGMVLGPVRDLEIEGLPTLEDAMTWAENALLTGGAL